MGLGLRWMILGKTGKTATGMVVRKLALLLARKLAPAKTNSKTLSPALHRLAGSPSACGRVKKDGAIAG